MNKVNENTVESVVALEKTKMWLIELARHAYKA